jgi:16S rRNA (guanine527-N7)-methyltransferase
LIGLPEGPSGNLRFLDVGSGAGFPGIPLQILNQETNLTLLEATNKKASFLEHIVQLLDLDNTTVVCARAEDLGHDPQHRETYDVVFARAVASLTTLVELTLPFAVVGGHFIAHKRGDISKEVGDSSFAVKELGGRMNQTRPVRLPELNDNDRLLVIVEKVAPTRLTYPRRSGIPRRRPLKAA